MGLEELFWLLVRLLGAHAVRELLSKLVADAQGGVPRSSGCSLPPGDAFDCDELGIYEEEDEWLG
jgi:hypothetical protein